MSGMLVTGGAGFIGSNFVRHWLTGHPSDKVVVLDKLTYAGNLANLEGLEHHSGYRFVQGDIADQPLVEGLLRDEQLDRVIHFAAESHVDRSIFGPDAFIDTNVVGTHALLKACRAVWLQGPHPVPAHRFHHVSTDEVFGSLGRDDPAFSRPHPTAPNSPYSASKAASDHLVRAYHHTYGLRVTTSNCSNNYGPYHFPEKLIPLCITNILLGKTLPIYGDGQNIRDWLYVDDHCRGIELVLEKGVEGETYNIGGNNEWTNVDIVNLICARLDQAFTADATLAERFPLSPAAGEGAGSLIRFVKDRPGHDRRYAINAQRIMTELGYLPQESFETGIDKTIRWYLDNEVWWKGVMDGSYRDWVAQQYTSRN